MTGGVQIRTTGARLPDWAKLLIELHAARVASSLQEQAGVPVLLIARAHVKPGGGAITVGIADQEYKVTPKALLPIGPRARRPARRKEARP